MEEWTFDFEWYDEIVSEWETLVEEELEAKRNLLIDFDEPSTEAPPTPRASKYEHSLAAIFQ